VATEPGDDMLWIFDKVGGTLKHKASGRCLDMKQLKNGDTIRMADCDGSDTQKFTIENMLV